MTERQHTPGPWKVTHGKVFGNFGEYITRDVSDGSQYVARMDGSTMAAFDQAQNARLIAAAPTMLAALKRAYFEWDGEPEDILHVRDAIKEATGQ